jgi:hypothetical protein
MTDVITTNEKRCTLVVHFVPGAKSFNALLDFARYCSAHPDERFWQALRNWSGARWILAVSRMDQDFDDFFGHQTIVIQDHDTFYREGK